MTVSEQQLDLEALRSCTPGNGLLASPGCVVTGDSQKGQTKNGTSCTCYIVSIVMCICIHTILFEYMSTDSLEFVVDLFRTLPVCLHAYVHTYVGTCMVCSYVHTYNIQCCVHVSECFRVW